MRCSLGGKTKFNFVDGLIHILVEFGPRFKAYNCCNMLVYSWIMTSVKESIAQSTIFFENVFDVLNELKERFSQGDYIHISDLQFKIFILKQDSRSVLKFYTTLKVLWEELKAYLPNSTCSCLHQCVCITVLSNAKH